MVRNFQSGHFQSGKNRKFAEIYGSGFLEVEIGALLTRCNPAGERSERCPSGAFAVRRKRGERVTRGKQRAEALAMPVAPTEIADCKPEKTAITGKTKNPEA